MVIRLRLTCDAFTEQYDAYDAPHDQQIGFLHLRDGEFTVTVPIAGGTEIYRAEPRGDGEFTDEERPRYLTAAVTALARWWGWNGPVQYQIAR